MLHCLHLERFYLQFQLQISHFHTCQTCNLIEQVLVSQFQHGWTWCWDPHLFECPQSGIFGDFQLTEECYQRAHCQCTVVHCPQGVATLMGGKLLLALLILVGESFGSCFYKKRSFLFQQTTQKCCFFSSKCRWGGPCAILGLANQRDWILIPAALVAHRLEAQPHLIKRMRAVDPHPVSGNVSGNEAEIHQRNPPGSN